MPGKITRGNCYLCGATVAKSRCKQHILTGHSCADADAQECALLKVEGAYDKNYWLYLDIPLDASLRSLDSFLRKIWLECCGHMSAFMIAWGRQVGKDRKIGELPVGAQLYYDYDFGSTTELKITVVDTLSRLKQRAAVRLLIRNEPYHFACRVCGQEATTICCECDGMEEASPFFCDACAQKHEEETEHSFFLPVTNSPRMGVCAYCGEEDVYTFDPARFQKIKLAGAAEKAEKKNKN